MAKISRAVFKYVEHELYNLPQTMKDIEDQRDSILYGTAQAENGGRPPGCISDTTGSKAVQLLSSPALVRMERVVYAANLALDLLSSQHRDVYRMKYELRFSTERICMEIPCSPATYYRYRRDLVEMVAEKMGFCVGEKFFE